MFTATFGIILGAISVAIAGASILVNLYLPIDLDGNILANSKLVAKHNIIATALIFILIATAWQLGVTLDGKQNIRRTANDILEVMNNEKLSEEDILRRLRNPSYPIVAAAINLLIDEDRIDSEPQLMTNDQFNKGFQVRVYFDLQ